MKKIVKYTIATIPIMTTAAVVSSCSIEKEKVISLYEKLDKSYNEIAETGA
ncbi:UNVERIFIED_CONTAM: hypothetical protein O8I53_05885 [Campylobacter lari]